MTQRRDLPERIRTGAAASLVGVTRKTLLKWACEGIIPGAAKACPIC